MTHPADWYVMSWYSTLLHALCIVYHSGPLVQLKLGLINILRPIAHTSIMLPVLTAIGLLHWTTPFGIRYWFDITHILKTNTMKTGASIWWVLRWSPRKIAWSLSSMCCHALARVRPGCRIRLRLQSQARNTLMPGRCTAL